MQQDEPDVDVLYLAGIGRSGSTLLCRTLGTVDGMVGTGELMRILSRGVLNDDQCGCGSPVPTCEVWQPVLAEIHRQLPSVDYTALESTRQRLVEGPALLPLVFVPGLPSDPRGEIREFQRFLLAMYRSIRRVTGCRVVVDASKSIGYAKVLAWTPGIRLTLTHLVRDSRGVAHSLARQRRRPGTSGRDEFFPVRGPAVSAWLWSAAQAVTEWVRPPGVRRHRVRYEDFAAHPREVVRNLVELYPGLRVPATIPADDRRIWLDHDHTIASNPNRARKGWIQIREDVAWQSEMRVGDQFLVTLATLLLLIRYHYPVWLGRGEVPIRPQAPVPGVTKRES